MRRSAIASLAIPVLGLGLLGAPCVTKGPQNDKVFPAKSLVIPMDNCYQYRDGSVKAAPCNQTADNGVLRAYGLVYFLLYNGVPVYWAIDGATPKSLVTTPDITVTPDSGGTVVKKYNWASGQIETFTGFPADTAINYIGGPFVIHADDVTRTYTDHNYTVLQLLASDSNIAKISNKDQIDIHEVEYSFTAKQVRPLRGTPPRLAILNINPQKYHKTSVDVMYRYAVAAGFNWPCTGNGDCAGGLGPSCDPTVIAEYLNNTLCHYPGCDTDKCSECNNWVSPAITATFNSPGTQGVVYDVLCDGDFTSASHQYADTQLATGGYKLLWAPHWDTGTIDPETPAGATLKEQLTNIYNFVNSGNNLFVECAGISAMETGAINGSSTYILKGIAQTQFQTTAGMKSTTDSVNPGTLQPFLVPQDPDVQIGDFTYSRVSGAITNYYPDRAATPASAYRTGVVRLITAAVSGSQNWDVASFIDRTGEGTGGTVAYLAGHDYSPNPNTSSGGQTAGTRIVLNTLFNLGFGCDEPKGDDANCNTGLQGECAAGKLKCSSSGALTCVPDSSATTETCNNGNKDYNCDGVPGQNCSAGEACNNGVCVPTLCTDGQTQSCYEGAAGSGVGICQAGTQTCSGGVWGVCTGQVLPGPAVCNGKDNDCDGDVDTDCPTNRTCTNGVCLPNMCGLEDETCPTGFTCCLTVGGSCTSGNLGKCIQVDGCSATCTNGTICNGTSCIDPCASVTCPQGTICAAGVCQAGGCYFNGCSSGQVCSQGTCIADPCTGVSCPTGTFCRAGDCVRSCESIVCPSGQVCGTDGYCEADCTASCGTGQICASGTCQTDPCSGKSCGTGQVCSGGACVDDPCRGVTCQSGTCSKGQCPSPANQCATTVPKMSLSGETPVGSAKGGCSTSGGGGLMSLLLVGLGILVLRRRQWALAQGVRLAGVAVLLVAAAGCKSGGGGGNTPCPTGQTNCGGTCVDLTSSTSNCGACGCACQSGYTCAQSACLLPTGNPYLSSISPSSTGSQGAITLQLTGTGFDSTAQLRIIGAGLDGTYSLTVSGTTSATATLDAPTMGKSHVGTAQVRVVIEPTAGQRLSSNALPFVVKAMPYLLSRSPAFVQQDSTTPAITLTGTGFVTGLTATLTPDGGTSQSITATYTDAQHCQVTLPTGLALGTYLVQITNPDGSATNTMPVAVREGVPVITSPAAGDCRTHTPTTFSETVTGSYLYPTSVARVSGSGLNDAVLPTVCVGGTQNTATGQCQNGLTVTVDLTLIQNGSYNITIWNPGSPSPLKSSPALTYTIKDSCP